MLEGWKVCVVCVGGWDKESHLWDWEKEGSKG